MKRGVILCPSAGHLKYKNDKRIATAPHYTPHYTPYSSAVLTSFLRIELVFELPRADSAAHRLPKGDDELQAGFLTPIHVGDAVRRLCHRQVMRRVCQADLVRWRRAWTGGGGRVVQCLIEFKLNPNDPKPQCLIEFKLNPNDPKPQHRGL